MSEKYRLVKSNSHFSNTTRHNSTRLAANLLFPRGLVMNLSTTSHVADADFLATSETSLWLHRHELVTFMRACSDVKTFQSDWRLSRHIITDMIWLVMSLTSLRDHINMSKWPRELISLWQTCDFLVTSETSTWLSRDKLKTYPRARVMSLSGKKWYNVNWSLRSKNRK